LNSCHPQTWTGRKGTPASDQPAERPVKITKGGFSSTLSF
jgi:hypothetical protein